MIHIGGNKLVFRKNVIGIFSVNNDAKLYECNCEYVCEPPYKSFVVAYENERNLCKVYYTDISVRTLLSRLNKADTPRLKKIRSKR